MPANEYPCVDTTETQLQTDGNTSVLVLLLRRTSQYSPIKSVQQKLVLDDDAGLAPVEALISAPVY